MKKNEQAIMKGLLTKLSAVRKTLSDEERELLDELILGSATEVEAHSVTRGTVKGVTRDADEVAAHSATRGTVKGVTRDADEVAAHSVKSGTVKGVTRDADEVAAHSATRGTVKGVTRDADEVAAHTMPPLVHKNPRFVADKWVEIYFDPETEKYQIKS